MTEPDPPAPQRLSTTQARDRLSHLIQDVQHPDCFVVLTRYGRPSAALVSMQTLKRIWSQEDLDRVVAGTDRPAIPLHHWLKPNREAAEAVQRVQWNRRKERETLELCGMKPVPGGELELDAVEVMEPPVEPKAPWWRRVWW